MYLEWLGAGRGGRRLGANQEGVIGSEHETREIGIEGAFMEIKGGNQGEGLMGRNWAGLYERLIDMGSLIYSFVINSCMLSSALGYARALGKHSSLFTVRNQWQHSPSQRVTMQYSVDSGSGFCWFMPQFCPRAFWQFI